VRARSAMTRSISYDHDPAIGETLLLADLIVVPPGGVELWQNVFATGIGFGDHSVDVSFACSSLVGIP